MSSVFRGDGQTARDTPFASGPPQRLPLAGGLFIRVFGPDCVSDYNLVSRDKSARQWPCPLGWVSFLWATVNPMPFPCTRL